MPGDNNSQEELITTSDPTGLFSPIPTKQLGFLARRNKQITRWFRKFFVKEEYIPNDAREICELYGEHVISMMLAGSSSPLSPELRKLNLNDKTREYARAWLAEEAAYNARRDHWISLRDFALEIAIIILILLEIRMGVQQEHKQIENFNKQQQALTNLLNSSNATANTLTSLQSTTKTMSDGIQNELGQLASDQAKSRKHLEAMASALETQLAIVQDQQKERLAQLAKKPKLEIAFGSEMDMLPTPGNRMAQAPPGTVEVRSFTEDSLTYDVMLTNRGDASATDIKIKIQLFDQWVSVECEPECNKEIEPTHSPVYVYTMRPDSLKPGDEESVLITFNYQGHRSTQFQVMIVGEAAELEKPVTLSHFNLYPATHNTGP